MYSVFGSIVVSISACQLTLSADDRGSIPRQRDIFDFVPSYTTTLHEQVTKLQLLLILTLED